MAASHQWEWIFVFGINFISLFGIDFDVSFFGYDFSMLDLVALTSYNTDNTTLGLLPNLILVISFMRYA